FRRLGGEEGCDGPHGDAGGADEDETVGVIPSFTHRGHQPTRMVLVGEPAGQRRPGLGHRTGDDPAAGGGAGHAVAPRSGPQQTKTGFSAANRRAPLPPRGTPRLTATWTTCPSRVAAAAARSRAA